MGAGQSISKSIGVGEDVRINHKSDRKSRLLHIISIDLVPKYLATQNDQ